jgi:hypothetical protein
MPLTGVHAVVLTVSVAGSRVSPFGSASVMRRSSLYCEPTYSGYSSVTLSSRRKSERIETFLRAVAIV